MAFWFPVEEIKEGSAQLLVPKIIRSEGEPLDHARSKAAVFYNPIMRLNRDTAVLVLSIHQNRNGRQDIACEPMCGSGVRGIRLIMEAGAKAVVMGDLNPSGVKLAEENSRRNGLSDKIKIREMDANLLLNLHSSPLNRFDYIDIDPYGSPSPYVGSAIRAVRDGGIIALTATDMAPLCGVNPNACLRKYGGRPLRTKYSHEIALRLLIGSVVKAAAIYEMAATPLVSFYSDHYVRAYLKLSGGAKNSDVALSQMGYITHCPKCLERVVSSGFYLKSSRSCHKCGGQMLVGGPLWTGETGDLSFINEMLELANAVRYEGEHRLLPLLLVLKEEVTFPPTFYNLDELTSKLKSPSIRIDDVMEKLKKLNFKVTKTHFDERGIKTDAKLEDLVNIIKG